MSRVRLVPIALIVVVSLAVLFGIWRLYLQFSLINPLVTSINSVSGVQSAKVTSENPPVIQVTLKPNSDLQTTYQSILQRTGDSLTNPVTVKINSSHTQSLWQVYEALEVGILQGVKQGEYQQMIANATKQAKQLGATAKITMDEHNVYLQIAKDHQYFYYVYGYNP